MESSILIADVSRTWGGDTELHHTNMTEGFRLGGYSGIHNFYWTVGVRLHHAGLITERKIGTLCQPVSMTHCTL